MSVFANFDQVAVGDSDALVKAITEADIRRFVEMTGDDNPLHADPEFPLVRERFQSKPILHGLCSYGFLARAVAKGACNGDATRIRHLSAKFSKPVWPGDTLVTDGWVDGSMVYVRTATRERSEVVLSHCRAEITTQAP